jgi:hypothetical protein
VHWKSSALPTVEWPDQFLKPENQHLRLIMFMLMGDRIIFPLGIVFPISLIDAASYEFLATFNANAPFRMTAKHFSVVVPIGKQGKYRARKPDSEITARLNEVILSPGRAV